MSSCRTSNNIILAQEIICTLVHKRGQVGYVALKLDLEKAYDKLEWSFIQESLEFFQVPPSLIILIMNMITSTRYRIQWNGAPLPEVRPNKGVRQGDRYPHTSLFYIWNIFQAFGRGNSR